MTTVQVYLYIYIWINNPKRAALYGRRLRVIANLDRNARSVEFEDVVSARAIHQAITPGAVHLAKASLGL